jgi:hypothetical protein
MNDRDETGELTPRAIRKRKRMAEANAYAKEARFWSGIKSADRSETVSRPVNSQASHGLTKRTKHR